MSKQRCLELLEERAKTEWDLAARHALDAVMGPKDQMEIGTRSAREYKIRADAFRTAYEIVSSNL